MSKCGQGPTNTQQLSKFNKYNHQQQQQRQHQQPHHPSPASPINEIIFHCCSSKNRVKMSKAFQVLKVLPCCRSLSLPLPLPLLLLCVLLVLLLLLLPLPLLLPVTELSLLPIKVPTVDIVDVNAAAITTNALRMLAETTNSSGSSSTIVQPSAYVSERRPERPQQPDDHQQTAMRSRRKRFIAFPEGSSFSTAVCLTTGVIGNPDVSYISMGLNWGIAYDLPNATWVLRHASGFRHKDSHRVESGTSGGNGNSDNSGNSGTSLSDHNDHHHDHVNTNAIRRRHRRELYRRIEILIKRMGYNGRDCILRALCESRKYFGDQKMGMIGEMLRVIFSLPEQRVLSRELHENADIKLYDHAYRQAHLLNCAEAYQCPFSLLELAIGRYSTPPKDYYKQH